MRFWPAAGFFVAFVVFEVVGYATRSYWTFSQLYAHVRYGHPATAATVLGVIIVALFVHLGLGVANRIKQSRS